MVQEHKRISGLTGNESIRFSTSADVAKLYCQVDAGFTPIKFVFGNVAYSIGLGGSIIGGLKSLSPGVSRQSASCAPRSIRADDHLGREIEPECHQAFGFRLVILGRAADDVVAGVVELGGDVGHAHHFDQHIA